MGGGRNDGSVPPQQVLIQSSVCKLFEGHGRDGQEHVKTHVDCFCYDITSCSSPVSSAVMSPALFVNMWPLSALIAMLP